MPISCKKWAFFDYLCFFIPSDLGFDITKTLPIIFYKSPVGLCAVFFSFYWMLLLCYWDKEGCHPPSHQFYGGPDEASERTNWWIIGYIICPQRPCWSAWFRGQNEYIMLVLHFVMVEELTLHCSISSQCLNMKITVYKQISHIVSGIGIFHFVFCSTSVVAALLLNGKSFISSCCSYLCPSSLWSQFWFSPPLPSSLVLLSLGK